MITHFLCGIYEIISCPLDQGDILLIIFYNLYHFSINSYNCNPLEIDFCVCCDVAVVFYIVIQIVQFCILNSSCSTHQQCHFS